MRIAHKIKMLMIPMMLLPFLFTFMALGLTMHVYLQSAYGTEFGAGSVGQISNPIDAVNNQIKDQMDILITLYGNREIEKIDVEAMNAINTKLRINNSFIIIRKDKEIIYQGIDKLDVGLEEQLPEPGEHLGDGVSYITTPNRYMFRQVDFSFADGKAGSLYVIAYLGDIVPKFKRFTLSMALVLACIFVTFSTFVSMFMHREFVVPIKSLKHGTTAIMEGDWDYQVKVDSDDEIGELCQSFNDMREQLKDSMRRQVESEEKNKELIANISHDLKTPITSIKGYVEGIMDGVADSPEKMEKYIRIIYNKANEMDAMINELSLYTKLNSNAIPYNFIALSIDEYLEDFLEEMSELDKDHFILHLKNYCKPGTKVTADPEQLGRVVSNIVMNSRKYCDKEKCEVTVRVKPVNDMVQFEFEDNGCGISEEALPKIFNRTYRADEARRSMGGSGLGLAIAKKVIEEHGGTMWASSRLTVGTSIFFTLQAVV